MTEREQSTREIFQLIPKALYVLIAILLFNHFANIKYSPKKLPEITLDREITMITTNEKEANKTFTLHKGDVVTFMGYNKATKTVNLVQAYVQTQDGLRGYFDAYQLGYPVIYTPTRDTVTIINAISGSDSWHKALLRFPDGHEQEADYDKVGIILPKQLKKLAFNDGGACYMSESKFKRKYLGKKLTRTDKIYHPATLINKADDGTFEAYYPSLFVFKKKEGCFYRPTVYTDNESVITDYQLTTPHGNNKWILKLLPLVSPIMDTGFMSSLINSSFYDISGKIYDLAAQKYNWTRWIIILIYPLFGAIWIFCYGAFLLIILKSLLVWRKSFYHLENPRIRFIFGTVAIITGYIWFALMLIWGLVWPFALLCIVSQYYLYKYSVKDLHDTPPHDRCLKCRRLQTMVLFDSILKDEFDKVENETEAGETVGKKESIEKITWEEGSIDGKRVIRNAKEHVKVTDIIKYYNYDIYYHVKIYHDFYKCNCCGNQEKVVRREREEIGRHLKKQSTGTGVSRMEERAHHGSL